MCGKKCGNAANRIQGKYRLEKIQVSEKKKKTNVFMKPVKEKEALVNSVLEQIRIPAITKKISRRMKIYLFRNDRSMPG